MTLPEFPSPDQRRCHEDLEHDDLMDADDYDRRRFERDGWGDARYDRQRW